MAEDLVESGGIDLLVTGDMGIGNTTPAAALVSVFAGRPPEKTTGRGTGIDGRTLNLKVRVVEEALGLHDPNPKGPLGVLAAVGGLEHAVIIVGVILTGAACGVPVILDGVASNSAAYALAPESAGYLIAGHVSVEPGAGVSLDHLNLDPLLDLDVRLGEGTGGLLAVQAAARTLGEMATPQDLGIG